MQTLTKTDDPAFRGSFRGARGDPASTWLRVPLAATRAIRVLARRALASYRQHRQAKAVRDALHQLDDRMLRDLGFHRDEIDSVAAEFAGRSERTRILRR